MLLSRLVGITAAAALCCFSSVDAREGGFRQRDRNVKAADGVNEDTKALFWSQFLEGLKPPKEESKAEAVKSSNAGKVVKSSKSCKVDIQQDTTFLGIEIAYSIYESELTLSWDPPIYIPNICNCSRCGPGDDSSSSKSRKMPSPGSKSSKANAKSIKSQKMQSDGSKSSSDPSAKSIKSRDDSTKSSKSSLIRQLVATNSIAVDGFMVDDDGYITEGVLYHVFVRENPADFLDEDFQVLIESSDKITTNGTEITVPGLEPNKVYDAFVLATINNEILPNSNIMNITISPRDPRPKAGVEDKIKNIPEDFEVTLSCGFDETFMFQDTNENSTTNEDMINCTGDINQDGFVGIDAPCANSTCDGIETDDSDFATEVFEVTICGPNTSWVSDFDFQQGDVIVFSNASESADCNVTDDVDVDCNVTDNDIDSTRVMHIYQVFGPPINGDDTCVTVSAIDSSPTYLFEELYMDYQIDPYYDEARCNIEKFCGDYCESTQRSSRRLKEFKKDFPFASLNIEKRRTAKGKSTSGSTTAKAEASFRLYAGATAYLRVKIEVTTSKFRAEIGGGYNYEAGFSAGAEAEVKSKFKGGEDIWKGKKGKISFTVGPVPIMFSYRPYVAYDYGLEIELERELELKYEISGGDYGAIVVANDDGGFIQVTEESKSTPPEEIFTFNDSCEVEVEAEVGVRVGVRFRLYDNKGLATDPALRLGIEGESESKCDGNLRPPSELFGRKEPDETQALRSILVNPPPFPPYRQTKFNIDLTLSLPLRSTLGIRFELPFIGGFWIVKIKLKFDIEIAEFPILTLPRPKPEQGKQPTCQCMNYPSCQDNGSLDLEVSMVGDLEGTMRKGKTTFLSNPVQSPATFVLAFEGNTQWVATEEDINADGANGDTSGIIEITNSGVIDKFCCGATEIPNYEVFLVAGSRFPRTIPLVTPKGSVPDFFDYSLISYEKAEPENCPIITLIEQCTLDQFFQDAIENTRCNADPNCNWNEGGNICDYDGIVCACGGGGTQSSQSCGICSKQCDRVGSLTRNIKFKEDTPESPSILPGEIKYLEQLYSLDLGPGCANKTRCLDTASINETIIQCLEENCTTTLFDVIDNGGQCWPEADQVCLLGCFPIKPEVLDYNLTCTELIVERADDERLTGMVPSEIFTMKELVDVDLSHNAFDSFEEPIPDEDCVSISTLDLRNNSFTGDLPCDLCDVFNRDGFIDIIVNCIGDTPTVNCRCCVSDSFGNPCSNESIMRHELACVSPSSVPSATPSISTNPSASAEPSTFPSISSSPTASAIPTSPAPSTSPTFSDGPSTSPSYENKPSIEPSVDCD